MTAASYLALGNRPGGAVARFDVRRPPASYLALGNRSGGAVALLD